MELLSTYTRRLSAHFLQSGRVEKCKTGTTPECVTFGASQTDEVSARLTHLQSTRVPIGIPSLLAETGTRLGPDVRASGPPFLRIFRSRTASAFA